MNFRCMAVSMVGLALAACSPGPVPVSRSLRDPSNPSAAEAVAPRQHAHAGGAADLDAAATSDGGAPTTVYVCPMHPEVTSSVPGQCPKCGMKLVPRK
jgi:hypothetical protein